MSPWDLAIIIAPSNELMIYWAASDADMGEYPARLMFRNAGAIDIEFMVDAPHH